MTPHKKGQKMLEKDIEKELVTEVRKLGGRAYKFVSPGNDGVPDRIVIMPDTHVIFAELKTEIGKVTKLQQIQINRLRDLGQDVQIVRGMIGVSIFFLQYGHPEISEKIRKKYDL